MLHRRPLRLLGTTRQQALLLLLSWCASLFAPVLHVHGPEAGAETAAHADRDGHDEGHCTGLYAPPSESATAEGSCPDGTDCHDPYHHHHPASQHDVSQCPTCSSLLARGTEPHDFRSSEPAPVLRASPSAPRIAAPAERLNAALARGPPLLPSIAIGGTTGI